MVELIYVVWGIAAVIGLWQGFFKQLANLLGVVIGLVLATSLYHRFGEILAPHTGTSETTMSMIGFVVIAVLVPILLGFLSTLLTKLFSAVHLGFINRLAGAVLSIVIYTFVMSFAFNVMDFVKSNGGFHSEKLDERPALYYDVKHLGSSFLPKFLIVNDATEEKMLESSGKEDEARHGLSDIFKK